MSIFIWMLVVGLILFLFFLTALIWMIRTGHFEDLETPPERIFWE